MGVLRQVSLFQKGDPRRRPLFLPLMRHPEPGQPPCKHERNQPGPQGTEVGSPATVQVRLGEEHASGLVPYAAQSSTNPWDFLHEVSAFCEHAPPARALGRKGGGEARGTNQRKRSWNFQLHPRPASREGSGDRDQVNHQWPRLNQAGNSIDTAEQGGFESLDTRRSWEGSTPGEDTAALPPAG